MKEIFITLFLIFFMSTPAFAKNSVEDKKAEAAKKAAINSEAFKEFQACIRKARSQEAHTKCREAYTARLSEVVKEIQDATSKVKD